MYSFLCSGLVGIATAIVFSFCLTDLGEAEDSLTGWIVVYVMHKATGATGAVVLMSLVIALNFLGGAVFLASAARQLRGFTRDSGLPCSPWLKQVCLPST